MKKLILMAAVTWMAGISQASTVPISGDGAWGDFTGSMNYSSNAAGTFATITVSLTNTSAPANGGFLTAFAFSLPTSPVLITRGFGYLTPRGVWNGLGTEFVGLNTPHPPDTILASPFGNFDVGISATGGGWIGGGDPKNGLAVGESGTFQFFFSGTGLNALTTMSILDAKSSEGTAGLVARFRGFVNDESDKVPSQVVPEPGTYAALLAGGVALLAWRKRRA